MECCQRRISPSGKRLVTIVSLSLKRIVVRRKAGLTGEGVAASWLGRRVQPLQQRLNYGFEYTGPEDPGRVTKERLSDAELLDRLQHMFAQLKVLPTAKNEYSAANPPPNHLGHNFMDLPPLPPPPPARNTGTGARSAARVGEESVDSEATLTDNPGDRKQGGEAEKK
ncbi:uncharacterized protein [Miscanthus floridulus]|uniref:uncharacterized protein isoform X1 n=1 Tax=Miscanthus floridulus TaxID=154761 RepID=UPI00345A8F1D